MTDARQQMTTWAHTAFKAVNGAFGKQIDWKRESPEITKAQETLDFYLGAYFYSEMEGGPTVTLNQVRDAWRVYWKLHLTGQQSLV